MIPSGPSGTHERLNRFLARAGVGSRRRADELIAAGRVRLNGSVVEKLATVVDPEHDTVTLDGRRLAPPSGEAVWIVFNKPAGALTSRRDVRGRRTIFNLFPPAWHQLITVGRLDLDTEGVLLLTSDGIMAHRLMHPRYEIERVYEAQVTGVPSHAVLQRLSQGVDLGDPTIAHADAQVQRRLADGAWIRLVLHEGRKREVKRLLATIGHPVLKLRRIAYAGITARGLRPGQWRALTVAEVSQLQRLAGITPP
jgi:23S rRNA pseudouridine2605 synthase